jgi:hypothetical protein
MFGDVITKNDVSTKWVRDLVLGLDLDREL